MQPQPRRTRPRRRRLRTAAAALVPLLLLASAACGADSAGERAQAPPSGAAPERFRHPGVVVGGAQLAAVRRHVAAGDEPWTSAYRAMGSSAYAALDYAPHPAATVACASNAGRVERTMGPDVEVALNHLEGRLGMRLPQTARLAASQRPGGTDGLFVAWETLTHARNPTPA